MANNVKYICTRCGAEDHDFGTLTPPLVLNCHACGAGRGVEVIQQLQSKIGMFPEQNKEEKNAPVR